MCLGEFGTVVIVGDATAEVEFDDGSVRTVSIAVLVAEGRELYAGDRVLVSMGMALGVPRGREQHEGVASWT